MTPVEREFYKNQNRPKGCESCKDIPCLSIDNLRSWMCWDCKENPYLKKNFTECDEIGELVKDNYEKKYSTKKSETILTKRIKIQISPRTICVT